MKFAFLAVLLSSLNATWTERPRYLLFGTKWLGWMIVEPRSGRTELLRVPAPFVPENVAMSSNGEDVVFTAPSSAANNVLLFHWNRHANTPPRSIGDERGYHSEPTISDDGRWVYFAHNPFARGPPGEHLAKAFAQLYRVRMDGTGLEALTDERGCHFAPTNATADQLIYVYTTCNGDRTLRRFFVRSRTSKDLSKAGFVINEPSTSPGLSRVLFSSPNVDSVSIAEIDLKTSQLSLGFKVEQTALPARPQYGQSLGDIFYQAHGAVWRRHKGVSQRIATFTGEP
jgi:hypothetical protein